MLRLASILALLALAVTVVAGQLHGTQSAFTDSQTVDIAISSGSVAVERAGDGMIFSSAPLAPGDTARATVTVTNTGSLASVLALGREQLASTAPGGCDIRDALELKVVDDSDAAAAKSVVESTPLAEAGDAVALGSFAAGEKRTYEVSLTFAPQGGDSADDNDNCFQGSTATERFSWQAVEAQS